MAGRDMKSITWGGLLVVAAIASIALVFQTGIEDWIKWILFLVAYPAVSGLGGYLVMKGAGLKIRNVPRWRAIGKFTAVVGGIVFVGGWLPAAVDDGWRWVPVLGLGVAPWGFAVLALTSSVDAEPATSS